ncbi:hypothetical protein [Nocardioides sp. LS1]|uniref:hypothetical protein n=1 Tax=Nocardioides sp. LS1 TaxID=1027620 RepID=UPI000F627A68|nr:hypothetical protein [Nocardioides sp. LS1]GCD89045.1 hypothetical protein NLS1_10510 [Nocardioides sp. LS1]
MTTRRPPAILRGNIRLTGFQRISHGAFREVVEGLEPFDEFLLDLKVWQLVLPAGAAFTHLTAAALLGWHTPTLPEHLPVFAVVGQGDPRPRRPGLLCSRVLRPAPPRLVHGLPVEPVDQILLRLARDLGHLDLVVIIDSARRLGHITPAAMARVLNSRRPGVRNLRAAWEASTAKSQSAGETVLRLFDECMEVPVEPQALLHDEAGNVVGQADLLVVGTKQLHEYDGAVHRRKDQHRVDLRRERGLARAGYQRRGFTLDDLLNHPAVTMHEVDRDLERGHVMARLRAWRALVDNSLYSEPGRRRLVQRWNRQMGVTDWSRTA